MKNIFCTLLLSLAVILAAGAPTLPDEETLLLQARVTPFRLSLAMEHFTKKLYYELATHNKGNNLVYSPFSIHVATSMLFYGSPEESTTFKQLSDLLGLMRRDHYRDYLLNYLLVLSAYEHPSSYVLSANRLYADDSVELEDNFKTALSRFYKSTARSVDMQHDGAQVAKEINNFVFNATKGTIDRLLSSGDIDELTRLVLINAVYFKGNWLNRFEENQTKPGLFKTEDGERLSHPKMMNNVGNYWVSLNDDVFDADIIDLPYENQDFSMLLFIPNDERDFSLKKINKIFNNHNGSLFDEVYHRMTNRRINLTIPSFEIESTKDVSESFIALGVKDVFDQTKANLFDISSNYKDLHVDYILHKARIRVDEVGSEASAATAIIVGTRSSSSRDHTLHIKADRPFVFIITDKRFNLPLFFGNYVKPRDNRRFPLQTHKHESRRVDCVEGSRVADGEQVSFPCKGKTTRVLKNLEDEQKQLIRSRKSTLTEN